MSISKPDSIKKCLYSVRCELCPLLRMYKDRNIPIFDSLRRAQTTGKLRRVLHALYPEYGEIVERVIGFYEECFITRNDIIYWVNYFIANPHVNDMFTNPEFE